MTASRSGGRAGSLPVSPTQFISRERELTAVGDLFQREDVRLVTLTGPGGVGKTRLAIECAKALLTAYPDGVVFVSLAPITDPNLVASAVAQAIGVRQSPDEALIDSVNAVIGGRRLLLVLDNFEHVLDAAPFVADLLVGCSELKVLVTSRARLRIRGEHEFIVDPLDVPDAALSPIDRFESFDSVALFVERTGEIQPEFELTEANSALVAGICRRLDGLPLAIELAAARMKMLSPQALFDRLETRLPLLTGGSRDLPARQRTLREAISWSYDLLDVDQQSLFRRVAVFRGGFTVDAALAMMPGVDEAAVVDALAALVDHSLVRREAATERFYLLETIAEFAKEQIDQRDETTLLSELHLRYFENLAERSAIELHGPQQVDWLVRLDAEHDNLRAALHWSQTNDPARAVALAGALGRYWYVHGHLFEGTQWLQRALAGAPDDGTAARARAALSLGILQREMAEYADAGRHLKLAIAIYREIDDSVGLTQALADRALAMFYQGDVEAARPLIAEGLRLAESGGDAHGLAYHLCIQAFVEFNITGAVENAIPLTERSLNLFQQIGDVGNIAMLHGHRGRWLFFAGDLQHASETLFDALALASPVGNRIGMAYVLKLLGFVSLMRNDPTGAHEQFSASLEMYRTLRQQGDVVENLEGLAAAAAIAGDGERAAKLLGVIHVWRTRLSQPLLPSQEASHGRIVTSARQQLGAATFTRCWMEGEALSLEDGAALGLSPLPQRSRRHLDAPFGLTSRELDVLRMVAQGLTDAEVAERLIVARRTVNTHLTSIYTKLGVNSRAAATRLAVEHGLT